MTAAASCTLCISLFAYIKMTRRNYLFLFIAIQVISILQLSAAAVAIAVSLAMLIGLFKVCNLLETTRQSWQINPAYVISCGQQLRLESRRWPNMVRAFISGRKSARDIKELEAVFFFFFFGGGGWGTKETCSWQRRFDRTITVAFHVIGLFCFCFFVFFIYFSRLSTLQHWSSVTVTPRIAHLKLPFQPAI